MSRKAFGPTRWIVASLGASVGAPKGLFGTQEPLGTACQVNNPDTLQTGANHSRYESKGAKMIVDDYLRDPFLRLIAVVDQCNHAVKQGDWHQSDLDLFYEMKDAFMEKLYRNPPRGAEVTLRMVPFLRRCRTCKDQAGNAMREDNSQDFDQYLQRIPPCRNDYEDAERASLEMDVRYLGRMFCFHIPVQQARDWGVEMTALERKTWIPAKEFNHMRFVPVFEEIRALLGLLK